ncbi:MAG TPA: ABC transporter ATP-binding protein [Blastocatellia bacterium]|nr:ABC transporter ATP-binding protein [Blastocatellia bacterium]
MNLLTVNGISKRFGARAALQNVSFSVRQGEVLGLIGPNGAGKTTLFECLAGIMPSDGGSLSTNERSLGPRQRKTVLFYLPEGITPWAQQSVNWALGFFERVYASPIKSAELLNTLKLENLGNARIGSLSKGERKRLLLGLGLLSPQPLLMLDEPFDGLDLRQTRDVMALLRMQPTRGRTLMLSVHQLVDAARVCDRLILLSDGRVVGEGTIDELRAQANLREGGRLEARLPEASLEEIFLALT